MSNICLSLPWWMHPIIWLAIFAWEFYLGKKNCGSTIGLFVIIAKVFFNRGEKPNGKSSSNTAS
jgi:hypothetical protein